MEPLRRTVGLARLSVKPETSQQLLSSSDPNRIVARMGQRLSTAEVTLNAVARQGMYAEELWTEWTGKTLQELGDEWKKEHEARLTNPVSSD
jgi:hypothetical protein